MEECKEDKLRLKGLTCEEVVVDIKEDGLKTKRKREILFFLLQEIIVIDNLTLVVITVA